jgi:hypothetical protein
MRIKTAILGVSLNTHNLHSVRLSTQGMVYPQRYPRQTTHRQKKIHTEFYFMFTYIHFTPRSSALNATFWNILITHTQVTLLQYSVVCFTSVCPVLYLFPCMHTLHLCWEWPFNLDLYMEICMRNDLIPQVSLQSLKILQSFPSLCQWAIPLLLLCGRIFL